MGPKIYVFTDLADRPMILIRFNPDRCKENKKSCFDKEGKLIKTEWVHRIKVLKKEINKAISNIPDELMNIVYLF
jgi:DNA primase